MNKIILVLLVVLLSVQVVGQTDTTGLDAETKSKLIYLNISDETTSSTYQISDGSTQSGPANRRVGVLFRKGVIGDYQELDKDGENLKVLIEGNNKAMTQFNKAFSCKRKKTMYNLLELTFEIGAVGLAGVGLLYKNKNKNLPDEEKNKGAVIGAFVGAGVSLAAFYFCWYKSHQMLTKYGECIERAVSFYNRAIIEE